MRGMGDLETFLEGEFLAERRYRPALTVEAGIKWPTADAPDIGSGEFDYSLGLIASKEFVGWDMDIGATYTWAGQPADEVLDNVLELSVAAEWHVSKVLDVIGEGVYSIGGGTAIRRGGG